MRKIVNFFKTTTGKLTTGVAVVMGTFSLICIIGLIFILFFSASPSPEPPPPRPTRFPTVVQATPTQAPLPTPLPIATEPSPPPVNEGEILPEETPEIPPTEPPVVQAPGENPSSQIISYGLAVEEKTLTIDTAVENLKALIFAPELESESWRNQVTVEATAIQTVHQEVSALVPVADMQELHLSLIKATGTCNMGMNFILTGLDQFSDVDLIQISELIEGCSTSASEASRSINDFVTQFE